MMRFRKLLYVSAIAVPAVLLVVGCAAYVAMNVPGWIRAEPGRIAREYREVAEELLEHPETASDVGPRRREWRTAGRLSRRSWGFSPEGGRTRVWVRMSADECRSALVDEIRPRPYALVFYWGGSAVAAAILLLAAQAVWSLLRFLRERDDFLAATAHDLTTPLAALRLAIGRSPEDARTLVERLLLVVGNLKDFLRLGGRRPPPAAEPFDLAALVREAYGIFAADYRDLYDGRDVEMSADGEVVARGDQTLALQILWNLFGNDLKYAAPHGAVSVRVGRDGRFAVAEFSDEGPGMSRREMRRAFDRYYRAKTVLQSGKGGFGIGLCTSREFARAMGGDLSVRAGARAGCVFTLRLPAGRARRSRLAESYPCLIRVAGGIIPEISPRKGEQ